MRFDRFVQAQALEQAKHEIQILQSKCTAEQKRCADLLAEKQQCKAHNFMRGYMLHM